MRGLTQITQKEEGLRKVGLPLRSMILRYQDWEESIDDPIQFFDFMGKETRDLT